MIIDILTLRKTCITAGFVDPRILKLYVSTGTVREVKNFLKSLREKYSSSPSIISSEIEKHFQEKHTRGRRLYKYLGELLQRSFDENMIDGETYDRLSKQFVGIEDYDDTTKKKIEERWRNEYATNDGIYGILQGNPQNVQISVEKTPLAASIAARKSKEK